MSSSFNSLAVLVAAWAALMLPVLPAVEVAVSGLRGATAAVDRQRTTHAAAL
jgi:hypothetical protein